MLGVKSRGDTIIEVLLAVTVFSAVAIGALSVMNRSVAIVQQSVELTQVRQQIDSQAELLRYIHSIRSSSAASNTAWTNLKAKAVANATGTVAPSALSAEGRCREVSALQHSFVVHPLSLSVTNLGAGNFKTPATFAKVDAPSSGALNSYGIWVQAKYVKVSQDSDPNQFGGYIDFYVQSCWDAVGVSNPATISTTVRLYDPETTIRAGI